MIRFTVAGKLRNFDSHIVTAFMDHLVMSKYQTRIFGYEDRKGLEELAYSIRANGLISRPIIVPHSDPRKAKDGYYELVTGHRRCSAIKMFMPEVKSAEFQCLDNVSQLVVMKIVADDNLQRRQLKTYEEGEALHDRAQDSEMRRAWTRRLFQQSLGTALLLVCRSLQRWMKFWTSRKVSKTRWNFGTTS